MGKLEQLCRIARLNCRNSRLTYKREKTQKNEEKYEGEEKYESEVMQI